MMTSITRTRALRPAVADSTRAQKLILAGSNVTRTCTLITLTALGVSAAAQANTQVAATAKSAGADKAFSTPALSSGPRHIQRLPTFETRSTTKAADSIDTNDRNPKAAVYWQERNSSYGAVQFEGRRNPANPLPTDDGKPVDHFSMNQEGLVFNDTWRMDSAIGEQRTHTLPMVGSGYRYSLPETGLLGVTTRSYAKDTEFNWTAGQAGSVEGRKIKSFETTSGQVSGLSGRQNLNANWSVGGQAWMVQGDAKDATQRNLGGALEYLSLNRNHRHTMHVAQDSQDHMGSWLDSDHYLGAWRQRFGIYRFDPKLKWVNKKMADDREGVYWRTDHQRHHTGWFTGVEAEKTNVYANPKTAGLLKTFGFVGIAQRLDSATRIGGSFRYGLERPSVGKAAPEARISKLKTFLERQSPIGISRFGANLVQRRSLQRPEQQLGMFWDQAWLQNDAERFKTSMGVAHITRANETFLVPSTGIKLKYAMTRQFALESAMRYLWQVTGDREEDASSYMSMGASWAASADWRVSLNGRWDGELVKADEANRDLLNRVYLTIAYQPGSGAYAE